MFKPCLSLTVDVTKDPIKTFERSENVDRKYAIGESTTPGRRLGKFLLLALVERGYISLKSKLSCGSSKRFPCVVLRVGFLGRIHGPMLCGCGRECTLSQHLGRMRTTRRRSLGRVNHDWPSPLPSPPLLRGIEDARRRPRPLLCPQTAHENLREATPTAQTPSTHLRP